MTLSCRPILLARVALILLVGTLSLAGCQESRDPHSYLGMTVADAKREFPNDGAVVYGRRGTSSPDFFTGQILLSPYAIRQPARTQSASHCGSETLLHMSRVEWKWERLSIALLSMSKNRMESSCSGFKEDVSQACRLSSMSNRLMML